MTPTSTERPASPSSFPSALIEIDEEALKALPPEERAQFDAELAQLQRLFDSNPLNGYFPYPKQRTFHGSKARTRALYAANQVGKTHAGAADDLIQALPPALVPEHLLPFKKFGFDETFAGRIITPDLGHTMEVILTKFRELAPKESLRGGSWDKAFDKVKRVLHFARGDLIDFMSFEQGIDKFGGVKRDRIHYDEEPQGPNSWAIYRDCRARLLVKGGDEIFTMTPLAATPWVYDMLWEQRDSNPEVCVVQASMFDAPHLSAEEIERHGQLLSKEEYKTIILGEPAHFEGLVYEEFDDELHVVEEITPEFLADKVTYEGIDPGLNRAGIVFCAFDSDNSMLIFDELYLTERDAIPENAAKLIKEREQRWQITPKHRLIDPAAKIRDMVTGAETVISAYERAGIRVWPGQNDVDAGIFELKRRLQRKDPEGNPAPALLVTENCHWWQWERRRYRRKPREEGGFEVVKKDDHLMDPTRYVALSRPIAPSQRLPSKRSHQGWQPGIAPAWQPTPRRGHPLGDRF